MKEGIEEIHLTSMGRMDKNKKSILDFISKRDFYDFNYIKLRNLAFSSVQIKKL